MVQSTRPMYSRTVGEFIAYLSTSAPTIPALHSCILVRLHQQQQQDLRTDPYDPALTSLMTLITMTLFYQISRGHFLMCRANHSTKPCQSRILTAGNDLIEHPHLRVPPNLTSPLEEVLSLVRCSILHTNPKLSSSAQI